MNSQGARTTTASQRYRATIEQYLPQRRITARTGLRRGDGAHRMRWRPGGQFCVSPGGQFRMSFGTATLQPGATGCSGRGAGKAMQREARRHLCRATPRVSLAARCGMRRSKQESLRRCRQMHAKHADGPGSGMALHGRHRTTAPEGPRRRGCPALSACFACIRLHLRKDSCLRRRAPHPAARRSRLPDACQNSMHQIKQLPDSPAVPAAGHKPAQREAWAGKTPCTCTRHHACACWRGSRCHWMQPGRHRRQWPGHTV